MSGRRSRHRPRFAPLVGWAIGALLLGGCFTSTADFQNDAQEFIENDEELATALDVDFTSATCEEPPDRDPGTTFLCDAEDADGQDWEFEIVILDANEYEVNVSRFP